MPEGDTVLRTARRLHLALAGRPLIRTELRWPTLGHADLAGRTVTEVVAYGKQILTRIAAARPARGATAGRCAAPCHPRAWLDRSAGRGRCVRVVRLEPTELGRVLVRFSPCSA